MGSRRSKRAARVCGSVYDVVTGAVRLLKRAMVVTEVRRPAGRLLVFRFATKLTMADVTTFIGDIKVQLGGIVKEQQRCLACGDLRATGILTPDVVEALIGLLRGDNPYIEKTGVVVGNATFGLQVERMFREAGNPVRQAFKEPDALIGFLSPSMSPAELAAARAWVEG